MGLEVGDQIGALVPANPPGTDPKSQADDHLRLIKTCVQGSLGLMEEFWTIPTNNTGLEERNAANNGNLLLIKLNALDDIEIGEGTAPVRLAGKLTVASGGADIAGALVVTGAGITSAGALIVQSGGANITGTMTIAGGINVTGAVNILGGNNLALSTGSDMSLAGGSIIATQSDGGGDCSFRAIRSGTSSSFMFCGQNLDASATFRPEMGLFHLDTGIIVIGNDQSDTTFRIEEDTLRLGTMPISAAGLPPGGLWRNGNVVNIV